MSGNGRRRLGALSRRELVAAAGATSLGALAGCSGILGGGSSTVWEDDFEDGALDRYERVSIDGDEGPQGFAVSENPAGEGSALFQATEDEVLVPSEDVSIEPPVTATFEVYAEGWSGIDFMPQWDRESGQSYQVHVRRNANGDFIQLRKNTGSDETQSEQAVLGKSGATVLGSKTWSPVTVRWTDGAIEATTELADDVVRIEADSLTGNPFGIKGYWYNGLGGIDRLRIRSPGDPIAETTAGQS